MGGVWRYHNVIHKCLVEFIHSTTPYSSIIKAYKLSPFLRESPVF